MTVAGFTSTGSKRPQALYGDEHAGMPVRMLRSAGCTVVAEDGREYLDFLMALGAVALGYGHPEVVRAAVDAVERGGIGPLAPLEEEQLAAELGAAMPQLEQVRFLKTGAEAVAAAVRLARTVTGREVVLGCGYHGWLDWCSGAPGVPRATQALFGTLPFNDPHGASERIGAAGDRLACIVVEPVVDAAPEPEWLDLLRRECTRAGALLVFDEIKTFPRVARDGAVGRWGGDPDLIVIGKALANGFPLAAVGGRGDLMRQVERTWISSTMATECVALAAARATLRVAREADLAGHIARVGAALYRGLGDLAARYPHLVTLAGIPEMCYLRYADEAQSGRAARACAERGLLFKRTAYNFVSLAHTEREVGVALDVLGEVLESLA